MKKTLAELAEFVGGRVVGDGNLLITGVNTLDEAREGQISFLANPKYAPKIHTTRASAILVASEIPGIDKALIVTDDPYLAFAKILDLMAKPVFVAASGIDRTAIVHPTAKIGECASIGPYVTIEAGAQIGDRVKIGAGSRIGPNVRIGDDVVLHPNVVIYRECVIGDRVVLHSHVVIGSDGFGHAPTKEGFYRIPQIGITVIEDDVEIGANTVINRAAIGRTRIGRGTRIDSCVVISHNVDVGENCLFVSQVGISGSVKIGDNVTLAGQVGVAGHLEIGDNVRIGAKGGVPNNLAPNEEYIGLPVMPRRQARRVYATFKNLPQMKERIKALEREVAALKSLLEKKESSP